MPIDKTKVKEHLEREGLLIKNYRLQRGLTQLELGKECDCEKSFISAIERGKCIKKETEIIIGLALEVPLSKLNETNINVERIKAMNHILERNLRAERRKRYGKNKRKKKTA